MSTASIGNSSIVSDKGNFGHFRINQFVDTIATELFPQIQTPPNANLVTSRKSPIVITASTSTKDSMAQSSRPTSGQNNTESTPTVAPAKIGQQDQSTTSAGEGFGALELVELNSNPILDGVLGPNKDGRVRNPVPSKLKGKTDNKKGNFGVMHMAASPAGKKELPGKDAAAERDAAARRTSENTASRAKAAQTDKFIPPKKRGLDAAKNESINRVSPFGARDDNKPRTRPLTPDETKVEQARLLTLLRSINPITVVDQVCKAIAYFGGIPGAPPPEDGIFPESANTRETGALFIGWLAEIFPDISSAPPDATIPKLQEVPSGGKGKRGRGRPPRDSKGTPSGENGISEPPGPANGFGFGPAISAPTWGLPPVALTNTASPMAAPPIPSATPATFGQNHQALTLATSEQPATPIKQQLDDQGPDTASTSKRRRGRPKGSRNKGKDAQAGGESNEANAGEGSATDHGASETHTQHQPAVAQMTVEEPAPVKETPIVPVQTTKPPSMPKLTYSAEHWPTEPNVSTSSAILPPDKYSPEERAILQAFQQDGSSAAGGPSTFNTTSATPTTGGPSTFNSTQATPTAMGIKRKRGPNKPKNMPNATGQNAARPQSQTSHQPANADKNVSPLPLSAESPVIQKDNVQWASVETTTSAIPPPAKRQRKPKVSNNTSDPTNRKKAASVVSNATPPITASTIADSPAMSNSSIQQQNIQQQTIQQQQQQQQQQQATSATRPPADGLEAHYARFENLSQNGRSITPSITPQVRQHQKSASVQQSTPQQMVQQASQQGQQVQMQQQTSQQGNSRDDQTQKMAQNATARTTSNAYFPRNTATNYVSQYPSHQTSQQYTSHQQSPQISNSYRANTMTQPSPQFSQAENAYRTASPHSIAQPSPSFSQPDTYRTSSSLTQPSPTYTQPEPTAYNPRTSLSTTANATYSQPDNTYKPSSLTTSSYARAAPTTHQHQHQHQQSYSHFPDPSYIDLPTLEQLGHNSASNPYTMNSMAASNSRSNTNSLYGTSSGLTDGFSTGMGGSGGNDLLRVNRAGSGSYGATAGASASGMGTAFDGGEEMRERMMKGMLGRGR